MFSIFGQLTGKDPGFLIGGGTNPPGRVPTYKFARFSQKMHEMKKILVCRGVHAGGTPIQLATG